jgi:hypothetical protein
MRVGKLGKLEKVLEAVSGFEADEYKSEGRVAV